MSFTAGDLIKKVAGVLTKVPKRDFKNYFVRHCAVNKKLNSKEIVGEWNRIRESYKHFQTNFATLVDTNDFYQKVFVQLALVTSIMGTMRPDSGDQYGLYAGCALYIAEWCGVLSEMFFPKCHALAFYALWSPFMKIAGVDWEYQGTTDAVLMTLAETREDGNDEGAAPYALVFPGSAPCYVNASDNPEAGLLSVSGTGWETRANAMNETQRQLMKTVFGYSGKLHSRQVTYFNPADKTFGVRRDASECWAVDVLPQPQEEVQFEQEEEEDTGAYKEELAGLAQLLQKTAVVVADTPAAASKQ